MQQSRDMVDKALGLLVELGNASGRASDLARRTQLPLSTAHRLLGALVRNGFATFDDATRSYGPGLRVFQVAQSAGLHIGLMSLVNPILEQMSAETKEATLLSVRDGERMLYVAFAQGPQQVRVVGNPGTHGPLHCTSQGKVLIAFSDAITREYLLQNLVLTRHGPNSITSRAQLRSEIERVAAQGFAVADEEHEAGVRAISVPVMAKGVVTAALSLAAPAFRMSMTQLEEHLPMLRERAAQLSVVLPLGPSSERRYDLD